MGKCKIISAFRGKWDKKGKWQSIKSLPVLDGEKTKFKVFRNWQGDAFRQLSDKRYRILNAPTGSGKSLLMIALAERDYEKEAVRFRRKSEVVRTKVIITVPQNAIGEGYDSRFNYRMGKGKANHSVSIEEVLCHGINSVAAIGNFLKGGKPDIVGRHILVCTHSALREFYNGLKKEERAELFRDTILWVDESHHLMCGEFDEEGEIKEVANKLGKVVKFFLENDLSVNLATATFFRSDGRGLIPEEERHLFKGAS